MENEAIIFSVRTQRESNHDGGGFIEAGHPTQRLLEGILADSNDFVWQHGRDLALYLMGFVQGHIGVCAPCHEAVDREHLRYLP